MWFIMSYNALDGFHRGAFQDLEGLFYGGPDGWAGNQKWVPLLSEAKGYSSQQEARDEAYSIWGIPFVDRTFIFLEGPGQIDDEGCRPILDTKDNLTRRFAARTVTPNALKLMARDPDRVGLTWREQQIIRIMSTSESSQEEE